jgi:hypothetical protein
MAVSALTLTGMAKVAEEANAGKKKNYCDCPDAEATCTNARASRKNRKRYLRDHPCSYKGTCRGSGSHNPCEDAGVNINIDVDLLGLVCTLGGDECGNANATGVECVLGIGGLLGTCQPTDCSDVVKVCGTGNDVQCCVADATCIRGLCVLPIDEIP